MAVSFIRSTEWQQSAIVAFGGGGFELDTARVPWRGQAPKKEAFVKGLVRFHALPGFPRMFFDTISDDQAPVFPTVELNYVGFKSGGAPPPKAEDSLVQKAVTIENSGSFLQIQYKSPRTKWTWYQGSKPDAITPMYSGVRGNFSLANSVFNAITTEGIPVATATAIGFVKDLKTKVVTSEYTVSDVIENSIWQCSCVCDRDFSL